MRGSDETWTMALHFKGLVSFMMNFGNCVWWNLLQPIWCEGYTPHETTKLWLKTIKLSLKRTKSTWKPFRSSSQETMPNLFNLMMHQIIGAYLWSLMGDLVLFQKKSGNAPIFEIFGRLWSRIFHIGHQILKTIRNALIPPKFIIGIPSWFFLGSFLHFLTIS